MKYHCFFEQSGTFKNEFKKLGYEAYDNNEPQGEYSLEMPLIQAINKQVEELG